MPYILKFGKTEIKIPKLSELTWDNITNKPTTYTPASHTHSYLPLSGGTVTGATKIDNALTVTNDITASSISNIISRLFIKSGTTLSTTLYISGGYVSSSRTTVYCSFPLPKATYGCSSVKITSFKANIRVVGGAYVGEGLVSGGYDYCTNSNYTVTGNLYTTTNSVRIVIVQNTTYGTTTTCPNNSPVAVEICSATFVFS